MLLLGATFAPAQSMVDLSYDPSVTGEQNVPTSRHDALAVQVDGKVLLGGNFTYVGNFATPYFARIKTDGMADTSFVPKPDVQIAFEGPVIGLNSIAVRFDETILVGGSFTVLGGFNQNQVALLKPNGSAVPTFFCPPMEKLGFIITPRCRPMLDGRVLVCGSFETVGHWPLPAFFRAGPSSIPEYSYNLGIEGPDYVVYYMAPQVDGKLLVCGDFSLIRGQPVANLARLNTNDTLDTAYNPAANGPVWGIVPQPDGKLLVYGGFTRIGGVSAFGGFARLNADGTRDLDFNPSISGSIYTLSLRADGKIVVGGSFYSVDSHSRGNIAVLNSDGSVSDEYEHDYTNGSVLQTALQSDGKVVLEGYFGSVSGQERQAVARLNENVPAAQTLSIDPNGTTITWTRSGSAPELQEMEFALSTNNGTTFTKLAGTLARIPAGWALSGLHLPGNKNFDIRVRGNYSSGYHNWSLSATESRSSFFRPKPQITSQPVNTNAVAGDTGVSLSVVVNSAATVSYQWRKNGVKILGATEATYVVPNGATTANSGVYSVVVTSSAGTVTSGNATLTVYDPIHIVTDLADTDVAKGKSVTLKVVVTGTAPTFQWKKGSTPIPGATKSTYTITNAQPVTHEDTYTLIITNYVGTVFSHTINLNVTEAPPILTVSPLPQMVDAGTSSDPLGVTVTGDGHLAYQWLRNGSPVVGATSAALVLNNTPLGAFGKYSVKVSNTSGFVTSGTAEVGVVETIIPTNVVVGNGAAATLTAPAAGNSLAYLWKYNGTPINLVANAARMSLSLGGKVLKITGVTTADSGPYTCEVTGPGGMLESAAQKLIVTTTEPQIDPSLDFPDGMVGSPYSYRIPVTDVLVRTPTKFIVSGLPPGLTFNAATGEITGKPTVAKTVTVKVKASNASGTSLEASDTLTIRLIPTHAVGVFVGLISRNAGGDNLGGRLDLTTTAAGGFSGKLTQGAAAYPFSGGKLDIGTTYNHTSTIQVKRAKLTPVTLTFDVDTGTGLLTGTVSDGSTITGWRNTFSKTLPASTFTGIYTFGLQPPPPSIPGSQAHPLGYGYGTFKVAPEGTLTVSGKLADGVGYSTAGSVGPNGQVMVYQAFTTIESVHGTVTVTPAGGAPGYLDSGVAGTPTWLRKVTDTRLYAAGFGPLTLGVSGFKYTPPVAGQNLIGADTLTNDVELEFIEGLDITTSPNNVLFRISSKSVVTMPPQPAISNPAKVSCTAVASTGLFSGAFVQNDDTDPTEKVANLKRTAKYYGAVVRHGIQPGTGFGFFLLDRLPNPPVTTAATSPTLSGSVTLGEATP